MRPKVFIAQASRGLDFSSADEYGEAVFLTDMEFRQEPTSAKFNNEAVQSIRRSMQDYIQGVDYLVTTGGAIPNVIMGHFMKKGEHNILKWNNRSMHYELYKVRV